MFDVNLIRKDFPVLENVIYLDNGATTQTPKPAVSSICDFFYNFGANYGRGAHSLSVKATTAYEESRDIVSSFLNSEFENTVFTKNTTDAINIVSNGLEFEEGDHVITTFAEHHSNMIPWLNLKNKGVSVSNIPVDNWGYISPKEVKAEITDKTKLIAIGHISNVFGSIQNIEKIISIAHKNNVLVLVDGAQSAGHIPVNLKLLDCDFFATAGHKGLLGPQGTGILYMKNPELITPSVFGGGMTSESDGISFSIKKTPEKYEAGTPNIPGVIGLGAAVEYIEKIGIENIEKHERKLTKKLLKRFDEIENLKYYGPEKSKERGSLFSFNISGKDPTTVALMLDKYYKICIRSGYHCSMPGQKQLGISGSARASFALYNTEEEVDMLADALSEISKE
ncbi:MAG: cysteine desulfurase [Methanosarcinaceae archaeon]|nr:cysteine desulfurase [Methanosarcinaceae archaeon]